MLIGALLSSYVISCLIISYLGGKRAIGIRKSLLMSIFLTPITGLIAVSISEEDAKHFLIVTQYQCPECGFEFTEDEGQCHLCADSGKNVKLRAITRKII